MKRRKDFLYNPIFRVSIYAMAWVFISCFKLIVLFPQNDNQILNGYRDGKHFPAFVIGFVSGFIIELIFLALVYNQMVWSFKTVGLLFFVYILIALTGVLSLIKFRDYEKLR
ncbi:hypothetical protein OOT00_04760 [Desulfobotulus sp. H1]|uniref:Uncharacterized protein n=1 Tax=Desulfobotulus pelophilus TaxID=2823377 RepID=A0ABT3N754_9BACT|nr:hypothetical protein [Desulfobotulus pelophilus]MCW7753295.1 hypothetical protein [Desulfobotulus pelophilus]